MKHAAKQFRQLVALLLLATMGLANSVRADDYADALQLMRAGKLAEAQAKADAFLSSKPRDPQMRFIKGVIQRDTGRLNEAISTFTKLTEDHPELPEPYNNLAVLYAGQSQFDKARVALEMAIRTSPSYATAHENLGDVYAKLASQAYNKALQLDGSNAGVPPKLALIRELFAPNVKPTAVVAAPAAKPAPVTAPVTAPGPLPAQSAGPAPGTAAGPGPLLTAGQEASAKEVEAAVLAWAEAWSRQDMNAYLGAYGKDFDPPGKQSRSDWETDRSNRITGKSRISVKVEKLVVSVDGNTATAKFRQDYRANSLSQQSRKTLTLTKSAGRWLIGKETTGN